MKNYLSLMSGVAIGIGIFIGLIYAMPSFAISVASLNTEATSNIKSNSNESLDQIPAKKLEEQTVDFEEMTTNLKDSTYIVISMSAVTNNKKSVDEANKRKFQMESYLIRELSESTSKEMIDNKHVDKLLNKAKEHLNNEMQTGEIIDLYLTKKVIQ